MDLLLKIVIVDESPVRSAIIEEGLREAGYTQVTRIEEVTNLLARIYAIDPDVIIIDLPDVGTRVYTYIYTMANVMRACSRHGVRVIVCDRPNPVGGVAVEGPVLDPQFTFMTVPQLREAVALGGVIEITAGSLFRDGPGRPRVLDAVRAIGPDNFFVASDSGLVGTPYHTDALVMAARVLRQNGIDERALDVMFKENPARLLGLPPPGKND